MLFIYVNNVQKTKWLNHKTTYLNNVSQIKIAFAYLVLFDPYSNLWSKKVYIHFVYKENEAQKGYVTCLESQMTRNLVI